MSYKLVGDAEARPCAGVVRAPLAGALHSAGVSGADAVPENEFSGAGAPHRFCAASPVNPSPTLASGNGNIKTGTMTNQPTNQPTRRNPLAAFDPLQLLALRVLAQALADAQRHGRPQLDEDADICADICITNHAQLLAWLDSGNGIMWWDLARLPWYDSAAARWRVLRDANLRVLEL